MRTIVLLTCLAVLPTAAHCEERLEFTRMVAHWANYGDPGYLDFIRDAEPELVQLGFYGAHFWSLAHTPQYKGYPAHFPVRGLNECGDWFARKNGQVHGLNAKVVGHFNVEFLVGDPDSDDGPRGFFKFYRDLWDKEKLGPKPVNDPLDFLEKNADGAPIVNSSYSIGGMKEYWACLRNPHWQTVLKAWVRHGIARGLDGFIANYFYRHNCLCEHCQRGFRKYLHERFTPAELKQQFDIANVDKHVFDEIVFWHDPKQSTPLRREMLRWSQISNKAVFDEVFVQFGRSLKPDLIVAQWNHLGSFGQINGDERCLLPADLWGKDESYLWYSTGGSAYYTDLEKRYLGEGTLHARYIRGAFDDKPFTLGKYEGTRVRAAIAELAANGGAPMGFYTRFTDPAARTEIVRYYQFLKRYDALYRANQSHAEALLVFPRQQIHAGNVQAVADFRELGAKLLDAHVLFDVVPDDLLDKLPGEKTSAGYEKVFTVADANQPVTGEFSRFDAPFTVRVSASRPSTGPDEIALHFVNYNRDEPPKDGRGRPSAGGGIKDEKPVAAAAFAVEFRLPDGQRAHAVETMSPESPQGQSLRFQQTGRTVRFEQPGFLVYGVTRIRLK